MWRIGSVALVLSVLALTVPAMAGAAVTATRDAGALAATLDSPAITFASFPMIPPQAECADGTDNDSDGAVDSDDKGCEPGVDNREEDDRPPQCANGIDDDGDGLTDWGGEGSDGDCTEPADDNEFDFTDPPKDCEDQSDNDFDGLIDRDDPGCTTADDIDEASDGPPLPETKPAGIGTTALGGFPQAGGSYVVLSSGDAEQADNPSGNSSSDNNGSATGGHGLVRDLIQLKLDVSVPAEANCAQLDFRFYSAEYPTFVGSGFNDGFVAELDVSDFAAVVNPDGSITINAPHNFAFDASGQVISVNTVGFTAEAAAGSPYGGASPLLRASVGVTPGAHAIYLSIFDVSDSILDSTVLVDALRFVNVPAGTCISGATSDRTPPQTAVTGGPAGDTTSRTPTFTFEASEPGVTFQCRIDGGEFFACTSPFTLPAQTIGSHTFEVRAIDAAGNVGPSVVRAFQVIVPGDRDNDGIPDDVDTSDGSAPPEPGKSVNVRVVRGDVYIRLPGAAAGRRAGTAQAGPPAGFTLLKGAATVPVGSTLDTEEGRIELRSAANLKGATQTAQFYAGIFTIKQRIAQRAMTTDLVARVSRQRYRSRCGSGAKGSVAEGAVAETSAKRKRRKRRTVANLWGNGKGRFKTVGGSSAATVRGTVWLTRERCDGTLTKVVRGRVSVRDFGRRRNVLVRAGRSYLARATRAQILRRTR